MQIKTKFSPGDVISPIVEHKVIRVENGYVYAVEVGDKDDWPVRLEPERLTLVRRGEEGGGEANEV